MTRKSPEFITTDPIYLNKMIELIGINETADILGFNPSSLRQMINSNKNVRKVTEQAAKFWYENQNKQEQKHNIYMMYLCPQSPQFKAISALAEAMDVKITML